MWREKDDFRFFRNFRLVKLFCCWTLLLSALFLMGCNTKKDAMNAYLEDVAASQMRVHDITQEFEQALDEMSRTRAEVQIDREAWETKWDRIDWRYRSERKSVQSMSVPAGGEGLTAAVVDQYQVLSDTVVATRPLIRIADELSRANSRAVEEPGEAKQLTESMKSVENERRQVEQAIEELRIQSKSCEKAVHRELQKIQAEFGIVLKIEN